MSDNKETNQLPTLVDKGSKVTVTGGFDNDLGLKKKKKRVHPLLLPQQKKSLVKFKIVTRYRLASLPFLCSDTFLSE